MTDQNLFLALVPTILLPLTLVSVIITTAATYVAGWFGIELKAEGPKKLLELLLKPRIIVCAIILNLLVLMAVKYARYISFYPKPLSKIARMQAQIAVESDESYEDSDPVPNLSAASLAAPDLPLGSIAEEWTIKLPAGAFCEGTISGDSIFYGMNDGYIYELARDDGRVKRRFYVGTDVTPNPFIWNGRIYAGEGIHYTHHARAYAFDLASGSYIAAYPTLGHTEGQPVIGRHNGSDLMFVVSGKDGIHAVDPVTLTQVWHRIDGHIDAPVRVKDGRVFAGTAIEMDDKKNSALVVTAYAFSDGSILWQNTIPASSWVAPAVGEDNVYFALGELYGKSDFGQLACYDQAEGILRWKIDTPAPLNSAPVKAGDRIYVSDQRENVIMFNLKTQSMAWSRPTVEMSDTIVAAGVSYDPYRHLVLYPSSEGLYVLHPDTGHILLHWLPDGDLHPWQGTYAPVVVTEDFWYLCDNGGTVHCLRPLDAQ